MEELKKFLNIINNQKVTTGWLEDEEFIPEEYTFTEKIFIDYKTDKYRHFSTKEKVYEVFLNKESIGFIIGTCPYFLHNEQSEWEYTGLHYHFSPAVPITRIINTFKEIKEN